MCTKTHPLLIILFALTANHSFCALPAFQAALKTPAVAHLVEHVASGMVVHELLDTIHHWFSPENVQKHGEAECLAQVEQELKKINAKLAIQPQHNTTVSVQQKQVVVRVNQQTTTVNKVQSTAALNALQKSIGNRFKEVTGKVNTLVAQQTELLTLSKNNTAHTVRIQQIQDSIAKDQALIALGNNSLQSLATIASACGNNKLAYQIGSSGGAIMKMVDNVLVLKSVQAQVAAGTMSGATASMSIAGGWAGIAVGFVSLLSSFLSDDDDGQGAATQAIMDAICQLSHQMHEYHKATMKAFGDVHLHLQAQDIVMLQNFFDLKVGQQDIKDRLRKVYKQAQQYHYGLQGNIGYLTDLVHNQQRIITGDLASLRTEGILDLVEEVDQVAKAAHIPTTTFKDYATKLMIKGANRAKGPYVTGDSVDVSSPQAVCLALAPADLKGNLWAHPAFSLVNLLRNYNVKSGLLKTQPMPVVNPLIWTQCAQALTLLFSKKLADPKYPEDQRTKELDLDLIGQMHQEGTKFVGFVQEYGTQPNIDHMGNAYAKSMDEFTAQVQGEVKEYEEARSNELRAEVAKKIETETMQFQTAAAQCPTAATLTQQSAQAIYPFEGSPILTGAFQLPMFMIRPSSASEIVKEKMREAIQNKKAPLNYNAFLAHEQKKYTELMQQQAKALLPLCAISLTRDVDMLVPDKTHYNSTSKIIQPKPGCGYSALLHFTTEKYYFLIDKVKKFALLEQHGIGSLSFEYEPIDGFLYLRAFFNLKNNVKKNIYTLKQKFEVDSLYSKPEQRDESVLLWWHGGRYPKSCNHIDVSGPIANVPLGYYPSKTGYPGNKDALLDASCFVPVADIAATEKYVQEQTALLQAQERVKFNTKLLAQLQPSTNSKLFSALQKVEEQHALLESSLVLSYNEDMYTPDKKLRKEFDEFHATSNTHVCDMRSTLRHLQTYSDKTSALPSKPYELPALLQQAKQAKLAALQRIKQLNLKAQFACVSAAVTKLEQLKRICNQRTPPPPATAAAVAPQNPDITALRDDNKKLTETVAGLQQQMAMLVALMQSQQLAMVKK